MVQRVQKRGNALKYKKFSNRMGILSITVKAKKFLRNPIVRKLAIRLKYITGRSQPLQD